MKGRDGYMVGRIVPFAGFGSPFVIFGIGFSTMANLERKRVEVRDHESCCSIVEVT